MFFFSDSICKRWQLASCYEQALIGPSCSTAGLTPEVRQQILDFHSGKGKTLSWDCDLEQKSYDSIKTNEVDTSSIGHPANEYAEMPGPDHTMEKNVNEALNYWWDNNKYNARDKMKAANEKVGCTYKVEAPLFHIVCAYHNTYISDFRYKSYHHVRILQDVVTLGKNLCFEFLPFLLRKLPKAAKRANDSASSDP
ncbi:hypothetical protein Y032_0181g867 [Ancylostoma ceylanicum]|uniref:SCP domain-containing protein n=1 Tax=Ancylostoma ceylanicum TaxID=53326 RepID=A0A016ST49_9BILA|nr:hypothetical protein Y032_0181g867 [Ancylostoma ceylanicum]